MEKECPRSICCLTWTDGSYVLCETSRNRLLLFTSRLILRSICGGISGNGDYEFNCPSNVAPQFISSASSNIIVADTNNRRIQFFLIQSNGEFRYQSTLLLKEKPIYLSSTLTHFAISCSNGSIVTYSNYQNEMIAMIDLKNISSLDEEKIRMAFLIAMNENQTDLYLSNPLGKRTQIHQMTIDGKYLRKIVLHNFPFFHLTSFIFDSNNEQFIAADSINSIIYSIDRKSGRDNVQVHLEPTDSLHCPQSLSLTKEGHLIVLEYSLTSEHYLKIFRYHSCLCHSYLSKSSSTIKSSLSTSFRTLAFY